MASAHHPHATLHQHYHHPRKTIVKAARSAPVCKASFKSSKTKPFKSDEESVIDHVDDDMASGFLQFCAMCEKQIIIPNNSILYCSERCRRKDAQIHDSNPALSLLHPQPLSPTYDLEALGFTTRTILPRKLPTPRPFDSRIPPVAHNGKSDLDPTEWKPAEGDGAKGTTGEGKFTAWKPKLVHRLGSEAYGYLSQFHRSAPTTTPRPVISLWSTPSLTHTPTTTVSSGDSMANTPSELAMPSLDSKKDTKLVLPAKVKDAELISPTLIADSDAGITSSEGSGAETILASNLSYEKRLVFDSKASAAGSLKRLLGNRTFDITTSCAM